MTRTLIRRITVIVFLMNALAVTWPVLTFFRMPEPFPLGMPMSMIWLTSSSLGWNFSRLKIRLLPSLSSPPRLNERPEHLEARIVGSEIIALRGTPSRRR